MFSIYVLAVACAASATPLAKRVGYPPTLGRQGFSLVANLTDAAGTASLFNDPIHQWCLSGVHTGAGIDTGVLSACRGGDASLFQNQTVNDDGTPGQSTIVVPTVSDFPLSLNMEDSWVGLRIGYGTKGVHIARVPEDANHAKVLGPTAGSFIVCNITNPHYGNPQYPVRYIALGEQVPELCAGLNLLPQCAPLPEAPPSLPYYYWFAQVVHCYENVAAIDWSKY